MQLPNEREPHEAGIGDAPRDTAPFRENIRQAVLRNEVIGPFERCIDCK